MKRKKRLISFLILNMFLVLPVFAWPWSKKPQQTTLLLSSFDPLMHDSSSKSIQENRYFKKNEKIYFMIISPEGFESDYLRYQVVKQDDNAHMGGYSRYINKTVRLKDKNKFSDYFIIHQSGRYYLQVFDIQDTNHWLNLEGFMVIDE